MGRTYLFECLKCGYRAQVAGGAAEGAECKVQTVLCLDCKVLLDAVISLKTPQPPLLNDASVKGKARGKLLKAAPPFAAVVNRLPLPGRLRPRWQHFQPACPVAARHRVREWNQPDKCPRCGVFLERGALPLREWD